MWRTHTHVDWLEGWTHHNQMNRILNPFHFSFFYAYLIITDTWYVVCGVIKYSDHHFHDTAVVSQIHFPTISTPSDTLLWLKATRQVYPCARIYWLFNNSTMNQVRVHTLSLHSCTGISVFYVILIFWGLGRQDVELEWAVCTNVDEILFAESISDGLFSHYTNVYLAHDSSSGVHICTCVRVLLRILFDDLWCVTTMYG